MRLTRRHIYAASIWTGLALGAWALLAYLLGFFVNIYHNSGNRIVHFGRGAISIQWQPTPSASPLSPGTPNGWNLERAGSRPWRWQPRSTDPGLDATTSRRTPGLFVLPYWILVGIGMVALIVFLPPGLPSRQKPCCPSCKFDLAGVPPIEAYRVQVRCPECGTISERHDTGPTIRPA